MQPSRTEARNNGLTLATKGLIIFLSAWRWCRYQSLRTLSLTLLLFQERRRPCPHLFRIAPLKGCLLHLWRGGLVHVLNGFGRCWKGVLIFKKSEEDQWSRILIKAFDRRGGVCRRSTHECQYLNQHLLHKHLGLVAHWVDFHELLGGIEHLFRITGNLLCVCFYWWMGSIVANSKISHWDIQQTPELCVDLRAKTQYSRFARTRFGLLEGFTPTKHLLMLVLNSARPGLHKRKHLSSAQAFKTGQNSSSQPPFKLTAIWETCVCYIVPADDGCVWSSVPIVPRRKRFLDDQL